MKFIRMLALLLALVPGSAFAANLGQARLGLIRGDVQIYTNDIREWAAASINMPLLEGDRIWAPEGARTEVQIQGGVYIRLGSATALDILAYQEDASQFYLSGGHAYINNRRGGIDQIQVDTPLASVRCYDNSLMMLDVAQSGATDVAILKGYAVIETEQGSYRVEAGSEFHLDSDLSAELSPLAPPDGWEEWNRERDRQLAERNRSYRYIPEELDDYAADLDDYGRWVYVTNYGYCWTPRQVAPDWAPYRVGRWVWSGGNYVWVSYEPWGWCPYHYGRWAFVGNVGWCWVPPATGEVYWGPGYVGWVSTPTYVGWVPLAPGEIYYGRGYYGPASVNITNVTINRTEINNYRNVPVRNSVTVVSRTTFVTGRKEPVRSDGNLFRAANAGFGPPAIRPTRATAMPVMRNIPPDRRPPERIRRMSVEKIRQERGLVREERGSAFQARRPGVTMPVRKLNEPQPAIRDQHPALPEATPQRQVPIAPREERQPPTRGPAEIRERPVPPERKVAPENKAPAAPRQQVPAMRNESPRLTPSPERGGPREPRWQEPLPPARTGVQGSAPTQPASRPNLQRGALPAAVPSAAPVTRPGTPRRQRPAAAPEKKGEERREAPVKPLLQGGERPAQ